MTHVHRTTLAAMSIMGITNPLKPDVCVHIGFAVGSIEGQIVKVMLLDIVQYQTTVLLSGTYAAPALRVGCVRFVFRAGLLT